MQALSVEHAQRGVDNQAVLARRTARIKAAVQLERVGMADNRKSSMVNTCPSHQVDTAGWLYVGCHIRRGRMSAQFSDDPSSPCSDRAGAESFRNGHQPS